LANVPLICASTSSGNKPSAVSPVRPVTCRLERLANADVGFDFLHVVFERLRALVVSDPARIGRLTEAAVSHEINDQDLHGDDLPAIVRALLEDESGPEANQWGHALVSRMRSRGYAMFPEG
jgi:hypothetical protein